MELFPDLAEPLQKIIDRLFDLHPVVKDNFYHPQMGGSWSIKAVLPCIAPHMNYAQLEGINEGTGASIALDTGIVPLGNMEAVQFHPTTLSPSGILVTEGCRGDGGYLLDKNLNRFYRCPRAFQRPLRSCYLTPDKTEVD